MRLYTPPAQLAMMEESYADRIFTTEVVSYPEMVHIGEDKDFTPVIEKALALGGYQEDKQLHGINGGEKSNDRLWTSCSALSCGGSGGSGQSRKDPPFLSGGRL